MSSKTHTTNVLTCWLVPTLTLLISVVSFNGLAATNAAEQNFKTFCASCHLGAMPEAPALSALKLYPPERIVTALESGVMSTQGLALSKKDKHELATFITGKTYQEKKLETHFSCKEKGVSLPTLSQSATWNSFGGNHASTRYQANENAINKSNVKQLALKWAFAFPGATRVRSQPVVTPEMLFIGSQEGTVYALDNEAGCSHWEFNAEAEVRGSLFLQHDEQGKPASLLFGDFKANVYAIDPQTGQLQWKTNIGNHPLATITGSAIADNTTVYVPLSSTEVIPASRPQYECCTFRGTLVALDVKTGKKRWHTFTVDQPKPMGKSSIGTQQHGPSGAPIWSSPTLDKKRQLVYVTTGQNYSSPATHTSDAVLAIDMNSGEIKWSTQVTKNDAWNGACIAKRPNCPKEDGPDFDLGASPVLITDKQGQDWLILGQKSGKVYGLNPDNNGKLIWEKRLGSGGTMGGVHWGLSSDGTYVYAGISDLPTGNKYSVGKAQPGLNAVNLQTGERIWQYTPPFVCPKDGKFRCFNGISAAVTSTQELVYAGSLDGHLHIVDSKSGELLWNFDTTKPITTINGVKGFGGAIEADGPVIANGHLYVTSGYDKWREAPGNLLMVFSVPK